ncbi:MAG: flavodoxin [Bacteroidota bacterium]|nr:flavodoxin [Bacteroidota bacterium]
MNKTAIIYSFNPKKTGKIATQIQEGFNDPAIEMLNAEEITEDIFLSFDQIIMGVPTWFDGELPNYWDEFVPALEEMDLKNKKIALFGLGDQKGYAENFLDGVGIMAEILEARGGVLVGYTSTEGYEFESSRAVRKDQFVGLAIDYENQGSMNKQRVAAWIDELKKDFA